MVGTITPVVYGPRSSSRWPCLMGHFALALVTASLLMGAMLSGLGIALRAVCPWNGSHLTLIFLGTALIGAMHDLRLLPFRLPSRDWQVPQSWKRLSPKTMAFCYGFGIGLGVVTRIPFGGYYPVLVACIGFGNFLSGTGLMGLYGIARAGAIALVASGQNEGSPVHERLLVIGRLKTVVRIIDGVLLAVVAGALGFARQ